MRKREERFFGNGNSSNSDGRAWTIYCKICNDSAIVPISKIIPPAAIIKQFRHQGWGVGVKSNEDICPRCREPIAPVPISNEDAAMVLLRQQYKILNNECTRLRTENAALRSTAPIPKVIAATETLEKLVRDIHGLLWFERVEEAMRKIEEAFPTWPWPERIPKETGSLPPKQQRPKDSGFDSWLVDLERQRRA